MSNLTNQNGQMVVAPSSNEVFEFFGFDSNSCIEGVHYTVTTVEKIRIYEDRDGRHEIPYTHTIITEL